MKTTPLLLSLTYFVLHAFHVCSAQEVISTIDITMNSVMDETKQAQSIANLSTGGFNLVLSDLKKVYVYELDSLGKITREVSKEKPNTNLILLLGGITHNGNTTVFLTGNNRSGVTSVPLDAETAVRKTEFLSNKERYIESFEYNNRFYLLTLQKYTSILTLYRFDHTGNADSRVIDLSRFRFANSSRNKLYTVLSDSVNNTDMLMISKVKTNIPNTFDEVLNGGKLYIENGKMILTLDNSTRSTILITVRLDNLTYALSSFQQLNTACDDIFTRSNSFLYRGNLYQVKFCNEEIHFQVYDTCKKAVIKRHLVNAENFDIFRNTIISRVGTGKESINANKITFKRAAKDLDSAKVAIRKITKGQPAILVFGPNEQPVVTIGGQSSFYMTLGGGPVGGYSTSAVPAYYGTGLKLQTDWANYFRTLLDKNFDHQEGEIVTTAYDDLIAYVKSNNKKELAQLLFEWENRYILGYYDMELHQYCLVSFKGKY